MEKELNIAAILKEKPKNTKLWTYIYGDVYLDGVNNIEGIKLGHHGAKAFLLSSGKVFEDGEVCIFPSKEMRSWEKFAWKKGDVLTDEERFVVFKGFNTDDYTEFSAPFEYEDDAFRQDLWFVTNDFRKVSDNIAQEVIKKIEEHYGGKLNLETLAIEQPKPEFKDGDIVAFGESVAICKKFEEDKLYFYACIDDLCGLIISDSVYTSLEYRLATDPEKQKFFDALAKENKVWDAEKKMLVDLPKKCEFKPMDWCLMKQSFNIWCLCQYAFKNDRYSSPYFAIGGNAYNECIPYNDSTKHLLGTTDEWKGGEG